MPKKSSAKTHTAKLIKALQKKRDHARGHFHEKHHKAGAWLKENDLDLSLIRDHSKNLLTSGAVLGTLLLSTPSSIQNLNTLSTVKQRLDHLDYKTDARIKNLLITEASSLKNSPPGHLEPEDQEKLESFLLKNFGIKASNKLEGQQLNHSVGFIGYEQHLKRFPGDTLELHDEEKIAGIAPGLGGWGYFTHSRTTLSETDYQREKYYYAVQTLYLPNWASDLQYLVKWYKYRKMIAINPANGQMVVGVVADAGPANWTGKQFGGSPEAMKALDLHLKSRKGKIFLFFVDDPEDKIPLGPVNQAFGSQVNTT